MASGRGGVQRRAGARARLHVRAREVDHQHPHLLRVRLVAVRVPQPVGLRFMLLYVQHAEPLASLADGWPKLLLLMRGALEDIVELRLAGALRICHNFDQNKFF